MVCFILFTPMGSRLRSRSVPCTFATDVPTGAMGLGYTLYSINFTFKVGGKHGSRCASRLDLFTTC